MNIEKYDLKIQATIPHPISPILPNRYYSPDILFKPKDDSVVFVVDTKNKYTQMSSAIDCQVSNSDLFQMAYYAQAQGSDTIVLLYPGNDETASGFPLKAAESDSSYATRLRRYFTNIHSNPQLSFILKFNPNIRFYVWRVDLSGSIKNTRDSVARLAQFLAELYKRRPT